MHKPADVFSVLSLLCHHITVLARHLGWLLASSIEEQQKSDSYNQHPERIHPAHLHAVKIASAFGRCFKRVKLHRLSVSCAGLHGAAVAVTGRRQPVLDSAVEALTSEGIKVIGVQVRTPSEQSLTV